MRRTYAWIIGLVLGMFFSGKMLLAQGLPIELKAEEGGKKPAMVLEKLKVEAAVFGPLAETKMTMTFRNPHDRQLAGDLYFPLPEGAFVSGYALDVNGAMVDGVVVEKEKGRQVFEALTRQRIDPGLVEWTEGNNFKTRVFPLPPKGTRTIMVRYISELTANAEGTFFHLPLRFPGKMAEFSLRLEVVNGAAEPELKKSGFANFIFRKWGRRFLAETELHDARLQEDLMVQLPGHGQEDVRVEKDGRGEFHFLIRAFPDGEKESQAQASMPRRIVLFWDASTSRLKADHEREFRVLKSYFKDAKPGSIAVDLVVFRNQAEKPKRFMVERGDCSQLVVELKSLAYDGGTQIGCIGADAARPDFYLLFSDGLANFGRKEPEAFNAPVYAVYGDAAADHAFLHFLAESSGGEYLNLKKMTDSEAVSRIGRSPFCFAGLQVEKNEVAEVFPGRGRPVAGRFLVTGKLLADEAKVTVTFGFGKKITVQREFLLRRRDAADGSLLRTFWAQKKIEELMILSRKNEKELQETGKAYGLVTPGTSLIVLDNLQQYLQYEIMPPESLAKMRQEYMRIMEQRSSDRKRYKDDKINRVLSWWQARIAWWNNSSAQPGMEEKTTTQSQPNITPTARTSRLQGKGIGGTVTTPEKEPLPGVMVILSQNGSRWEAITDENGVYVFRNIPEGTYTLQAELEGFKTSRRTNVQLPGNVMMIVDLQMQLGTIEEVVTVQARAPLIDVKSTTRAVSVTRSEFFGGSSGRRPGRKKNRDSQNYYVDGVNTIQNLPSGRDPLQIVTGVPGVTAGSGNEKVYLKSWDSQMPYLHEIKEAVPDKAYEEYLKQREEYGASPGFFLDCADYFFSIHEKELGLRILSSIAELDLENGQLLRILGHRLDQAGMLELSAAVFEEVLKLRPEEPQSWRDLGLVLASLKQYDRAIELLNHVVMNEWDGRFAEIETIALMELNDVIARAAGIKEFKVSPRLVQLLDLDMRIVLTWDADDTDIDLWVIEPTEEKAFYSHNRTSIGGQMSRDFTRGYGPEEYLIRKAMKGKYKIQANYYGTRSQTLLGPVTLQADIFTNFGRPGQQKKSLTLRLNQSRDTVTVGEVEF